MKDKNLKRRKSDYQPLLSNRTFEVANLYADLAPRQIATQLNISLGAVYKHLKTAKARLGCKSFLELKVMARVGIINKKDN